MLCFEFEDPYVRMLLCFVVVEGIHTREVTLTEGYHALPRAWDVGSPSPGNLAFSTSEYVNVVRGER